MEKNLIIYPLKIYTNEKNYYFNCILYRCMEPERPTSVNATPEMLQIIVQH